MMEKDKRERLLDLFNGEPDVMFVLSGNIVPRIVKGQERGYKSPSYGGTDIHGLVNGAKARVIACAEASRYFPDAKIVTTSYMKGKTETMPTDAWVMMTELVKLGVNAERIILEEKSNNGITELKEMVKLMTKYSWKKVAVITSSYHVPRIREIWKRLITFLDINEADFDEVVSALAWGISNRVGVTFVPAERILFLRHHSYESLIARVEETSGYKERVEAEARGLKDILEGRYRK